MAENEPVRRWTAKRRTALVVSIIKGEASAKEAERAIGDACIHGFGTLRPSGPTPIVRSDNGLSFQSRRFREACKE